MYGNDKAITFNQLFKYRLALFAHITANSMLEKQLNT